MRRALSRKGVCANDVDLEYLIEFKTRTRDELISGIKNLRPNDGALRILQQAKQVDCSNVLFGHDVGCGGDY